VVKVAVIERSARAHSGFGERGRRGGGVVVRRRGAGASFYRLRGGTRRPNGEGGGGLGRLKAKAQWGGRPVPGPRKRRRPKRGGGGSEPNEGQGLGSWAENRRWAHAQKEILFKFQLILEFGKTLENCTRRFRKKFDMEIFPKIF
jgi:hypothetical protein